MCSEDLIVSDRCEKLFYAKDGSVVGCSGDSGMSELVRKWFEAGEPFDEIPKVPEDRNIDFAALVLRPDGRVQYVGMAFAPIDFEVPAAIGSGSEVAIGLMLSGKSPAQAVAAVASRVTSVGGPVRTRKPKQGKQ
jgi:hypothetical protein